MKKFLLRVQLFFIGIFGNEKAFEKFLSDNADPIISIISVIKKSLDSEVVFVVEMFLPPAILAREQAFKQRIADILDEVAKDVLVGEEILKLTPKQRFAALLNYIKSQSPAMREAAYFKVASLFTRKSGAGQITGDKVGVKIDTAVQNRVLQTVVGI